MILRRPLALGFAAVILVSGCAARPDDPVLATVGPNRITLSEYRTAWEKMDPKDRPDLSQPDKRSGLLRDLVNKELLEMEAYRWMPDLDEGARRRLHRFAESQLLQVLTEKEVNDKAAVKDEEVQEIYSRLNREYKCRHILARSQDDLKEIQNQLAQGKPFEAVAKEKSYDFQTGEKGGELGWVKAGQMVEPFDHALYKMSAGQQSEPVESKFGWHIIRVDSVRTVTPPPFDTVKEKIRIGLLQQRSLARQEAFIKEINDRAKPENQMATIEMLDKKFYFELPGDKGKDPYAFLNEPRDLPTFTAEELAMPVVKFADRPTFTVKDFNEQLSWMPVGIWPKGGGTDEVEDVIRQMMRAKLFRERALELGLDKTPEYVAALKKKEGEMRVNQLYFNTIMSKINLSDADLRDYFEKNRSSYRIVQRSQQARIQTADSALAVRAAALWRAGRTFEEVESLVRKADPAAQAMATTPDIPVNQEPGLDSLIFGGGGRPEAKAGDVVGPVFVGGLAGPQGTRPAGWVVAQVIEVKPERYMTYDEAQAYLKDNAKNARAEADLKKLLTDLEKKWPVKVNDKAMTELHPEQWKTVEGPGGS